MIEQPIERFTFETHNGAKPTIELKLGLPKFLATAFPGHPAGLLPALPGGVKIEHTPTGPRPA